MKKLCFLMNLVICLVLSSCVSQPVPSEIAPEGVENPTPGSSPTIVGETVTYSIVAEGTPMTGEEEIPLAVAWRDFNEMPTELEGFPEEAREAIGQLEVVDDDDLYLAIYAGIQPSSRYAVKILSVTEYEGRLTVLYQVEGPPPGEGAATVMTYPFIIARVKTPIIQPSNVIFAEQKSVE